MDMLNKTIQLNNTYISKKKKSQNTYFSTKDVLHKYPQTHKKISEIAARVFPLQVSSN